LNDKPVVVIFLARMRCSYFSLSTNPRVKAKLNGKASVAASAQSLESYEVSFREVNAKQPGDKGKKLVFPSIMARGGRGDYPQASWLARSVSPFYISETYVLHPH
jgi:hypothetical protein